MKHRHLLPNEIDLLVDGEVGFGVASLRAHIEECDDCRAELELSRTLVHELEGVPHFTPSFLFAERVMSQVQVYEPWHVAALDSVRRFTPAARPMRVVAAVGAVSSALMLTIAAIWIAARIEIFSFVGNVAIERARHAAIAGAGDVIAGIVGDSAFQALVGGGAVAIAAGLTALLAAVVGAAFGLRAVSRASFVRRHR